MSSAKWRQFNLSLNELTMVHLFHCICKIMRWALICVNTLRPRQNGCHFADDTFRRIFMNENVRISINISLKFVPRGPVNNIPSLVQIMAWRRPGDKPLSEPMMVRLLTHICVAQPQWINSFLIIHKPMEISMKLMINNFQANFSYCWLKYLLWHCPQMNISGSYWWLVNVGSGNGLVPSAKKALPEPVLTHIFVAISCH